MKCLFWPLQSVTRFHWMIYHSVSPWHCHYKMGNPVISPCPSLTWPWSFNQTVVLKVKMSQLGWHQSSEMNQWLGRPGQGTTPADYPHAVTTQTWPTTTTKPTSRQYSHKFGAKMAVPRESAGVRVKVLEIAGGDALLCAHVVGILREATRVRGEQGRK